MHFAVSPCDRARWCRRICEFRDLEFSLLARNYARRFPAEKLIRELWIAPRISGNFNSAKFAGVIVHRGNYFLKILNMEIRVVIVSEASLSVRIIYAEILEFGFADLVCDECRNYSLRKKMQSCGVS